MPFTFIFELDHPSGQPISLPTIKIQTLFFPARGNLELVDSYSNVPAVELFERLYETS